MRPARLKQLRDEVCGNSGNVVSCGFEDAAHGETLAEAAIRGTRQGRERAKRKRRASA